MSKTPYRLRDDYRHWQRITSRWSDNDIYGHVNNVVYYSWFDTAVNAMLIEAGVLDIHSGAQIGLVVETQCRYARPIAFPGAIEAGVRVGHLGTSSVRYEVGIFTGDASEAAAEGHFIHVYVDRHTRLPSPVNPALRQFLSTLL